MLMVGKPGYGKTLLYKEALHVQEDLKFPTLACYFDNVH